MFRERGRFAFQGGLQRGIIGLSVSPKKRAGIRTDGLSEETRPPLQVSIRCGVHSGPVQVGNMGFHSRLKYGVMGASDVS